MPYFLPETPGNTKTGIELIYLSGRPDLESSEVGQGPFSIHKASQF